MFCVQASGTTARRSSRHPCLPPRPLFFFFNEYGCRVPGEQEDSYKSAHRCPPGNLLSVGGEAELLLHGLCIVLLSHPHRTTDKLLRRRGLRRDWRVGGTGLFRDRRRQALAGWFGLTKGGQCSSQRFTGRARDDGAVGSVAGIFHKRSGTLPDKDGGCLNAFLPQPTTPPGSASPSGALRSAAMECKTSEAGGALTNRNVYVDGYDATMMDQALAQAKEALAVGEVPVGCVMVKGGAIIGSKAYVGVQLMLVCYVGPAAG